MKTWKRIGIAAAIIYGWFGIFTTLVTIGLFSAPIGSSFLNMFAIFVALPFMAYPFFWMLIAFCCGSIVTSFWIKSKEKKKTQRPKTVKKWNGKDGYDDVELEPLRTEDGKMV